MKKIPLRDLTEHLLTYVSSAAILLAGIYGVSALIIALLAWFVFGPKWLLFQDLGSSLQGLSASERASSFNDVRLLTVQILAGVTVSLGAVIAWRQLSQNRDQSFSSMRARDEELRLTRRGQFTERFIGAVGQLGNESAAVRIGGIYALERISRDDEMYASTALETLAAYVREKPLVQSEGAAQRQRRLESTLQTCLTVLGRWPQESPNRPDHIRFSIRGCNGSHGSFSGLNLSNVDLTGAQFQCSELRGTKLANSDLRGADFRRSDLRFAVLRDVLASHANFRRAQLFDADLRDASLYGAVFDYAGMAGAKLPPHLVNISWRGAHLRGFEFLAAGTRSMEGCNFSKVKCEGCSFKGLYLRSCDMRNTNLYWAEFDDTELMGGDLSGANLEGARFFDSTLRGVNFSHARVDSVFFSHTKIWGGDFSGVNLREAVFHDVEIHGNVTWPEGFVEEDLEVGLKRIQEYRRGR